MMDPMTMMALASAGSQIVGSLFGDDEPAPQVTQTQRDLPDWLKSDIQGGLESYRTATGNWKPTEFRGVGPTRLQDFGGEGLAGYDPTMAMGALGYADPTRIPSLADTFRASSTEHINAARERLPQAIWDASTEASKNFTGTGTGGSYADKLARERAAAREAGNFEQWATGQELGATRQAIQDAMSAQTGARQQAGALVSTQVNPYLSIMGAGTQNEWQPQWTENAAQMGLDQANQLAPIQFAQNYLGSLGGLTNAFGQTTQSTYGGPAAYQQPSLGAGVLAGGLGMYNMAQQFGGGFGGTEPTASQIDSTRQTVGGPVGFKA